jgi:hypothetical protein
MGQMIAPLVGRVKSVAQNPLKGLTPPGLPNPFEKDKSDRKQSRPNTRQAAASNRPSRRDSLLTARTRGTSLLDFGDKNDGE